MSIQNRPDSQIEATRLTSGGPNKTWQYLTRGAFILVVVGLFLVPLFASNYTIYVLSLWAVTAIAAQGLNLTMGFVVVASIVAAVILGRIVEPKRITATHIFLKGAREPFLSDLPVWPRQ